MISWNIFLPNAQEMVSLCYPLTDFAYLFLRKSVEVFGCILKTLLVGFFCASVLVPSRRLFSFKTLSWKSVYRINNLTIHNVTCIFIPSKIHTNQSICFDYATTQRCRNVFKRFWINNLPFNMNTSRKRYYAFLSMKWYFWH